jgi:cytoskeletal protein CcmA (bactofilin family)
VKAVHNNIDGPYVIEEDIALYGTITGDATLAGGRRFILRGTIVGDFTVERGAHAILHGTVAGRVYNDGGRVELFGMANAVANSSGDAITIIDPAAHVMGRR